MSCQMQIFTLSLESWILLLTKITLVFCFADRHLERSVARRPFESCDNGGSETHGWQRPVRGRSRASLVRARCNAYGLDDVIFTRLVASEAEKQICVDPKRVFVTGPSNGGLITHLLACEAADIFAAAVSIAAPLPIDDSDCRPSRPISFVQIHGTNDPLVDYDGGGLVLFIANDPDPLLVSAHDTVASFVVFL